MSPPLMRESEPGHDYSRTLDIEADGDEIVLWEEVNDYTGPHLARLAIPAHLAAAVASRIMSAARYVGR